MSSRLRPYLGHKPRPRPPRSPRRGASRSRPVCDPTRRQFLPALWAQLAQSLSG